MSENKRQFIGTDEQYREIAACILTGELPDTKGEVTYHYDPNTGERSVVCTEPKDLETLRASLEV